MSDSNYDAALQDISHLAVFLLAVDGRVASWSQMAQEVTGFSTAEATGKHLSFFHPGYEAAFQDAGLALDCAARDGYSAHVVRCIKKDGTTFWASEIITAVLAHEQIAGYIVILHDLTEQRGRPAKWHEGSLLFNSIMERKSEQLLEAHREISRRESLLNQIIDSVQDHAIYAISLFGHVIRWSSGAQALYGYSANEILGRSIAVFFPNSSENEDSPTDVLEQARRNGKHTEQGWRVRKDGSSFWASGTIAVMTDVDGRQTGFVKVVRDLSERQQLMEELLLRDRAIQSMSEAVTISNPNLPGNPICYVSQAFQRMTGYDAEQVLGKPCHIHFGPQTDKDVVKRLRDDMASGRTASAEVLCYRSDGTTFWNAISVSPVLDDSGRLLRIVTIEADVTSKRQMEDELRESQKLETIGLLAGGVAHDFNNLLTVITGQADRLRVDDLSSNELHSVAAEIDGAAQRAVSLTRQLLVFSRRAVLRESVLNLDKIISGFEQILRRLVNANIDLRLHLGSANRLVRIDPTQFEQVLMNLVVNAGDAIHGHGTIRITTSEITLSESISSGGVILPGGCYVQVVVADNGVGMPPQVCQRIFEPFFTTKGVGKGTGLGMAVVHGIVTQSRGYISVSSVEGKGSEVTITLPCVIAKNEGHESTNHLASSQSRKEVGERSVILLVDDDPAVRKVTELILRQGGYDVVSAGSASEAREQITKSGFPDLLLTDLVMPDCTGYELSEDLRSELPGLRTLFMSGYANDTMRSIGLPQLNDPIVEKPFIPSVLLKSVAAILIGSGDVG